MDTSSLKSIKSLPFPSLFGTPQSKLIPHQTAPSLPPAYSDVTTSVKSTFIMRAWYLILPAAMAYLAASVAIPAADTERIEIVIHSEPVHPTCLARGESECTIQPSSEHAWIM